MKIEGLKASAVHTALAKNEYLGKYSADAEKALQVEFHVKPYAGPGHRKDFAYGEIKMPWGQKVAIKERPGFAAHYVYTPCRHAAALAVAKLLANGATKVILFKKTYTKWNSWNHIRNGVEKSLKAKHLTCGVKCPIGGPHANINPLIGANHNAGCKCGACMAKQMADVAKAAAPVAPPVKVGHEIQVVPLLGEVGIGEYPGVPSVKRSLLAAVSTLYAMLEIELGLTLVPEPSRDHPDFIRYRMFKAEFAVAFKRYGDRFARNMFDYLTLACAGEARYASNQMVVTEGKKDAIPYAPQGLLPALERVFEICKWAPGYGGKKWANIAKAAKKYFPFQSNPVVFIDHCVDLSHNGGLAFDKGFIFQYPDERYKDILDAKLHGSLLGSSLRIDVDSGMYGYILQAVSLGIIERPKAKVVLTEEKTVPLVQWGMAPVVVKTTSSSLKSRFEEYMESAVFVPKIVGVEVKSEAELAKNVEEFNELHKKIAELMKSGKAGTIDHMDIFESKEAALAHVAALPIVAKKKGKEAHNA